MLEGLDEVDWGNPTHAYGPATDVPDLIRALASGDQTTRTDAIYELFGNIWHQWTVYEATTLAIPFLIELLANETVEDRHWILVLLGSVARGSSDLQAWVTSAREAVGAGFDLYLRLLRHPDPLIRITAPYTLVSFTEHSLGIVRDRTGTP